MKASIARAMMTLATACMEEKHRAWGLAMHAELEEAIDAGKPLRFAFGCLVASLRRMPAHAEGRFSLTAHTVALGLMMPLAALQTCCAVFGFPFFLPNGGTVTPGSFGSLFLTSAYQAVIPSLAVLMLLLAIGHLRMAWMLLGRDWPRVMTAGALTLASTITIVTFMAVLDVDTAQALLQAAILAVELAVLAGLASWHADLPHPWADRATE